MFKPVALFLTFILYSNLAAQEKQVVFQDVCWAPDGKSIFYSYILVKNDWSDFSFDKWNIGRTYLEDGRTETVVHNAYYVTVSPNGKTIAFGRSINDNFDILSYQLKTGKTKRLTMDPKRDSNPAFSPDGKWIAFNSERQGPYEIYIMKTNGSKLTKITNSSGHKAFNPSWSRYGRQIAYYLEKGDGQDQIHIVSMDGSEHRQLTNDHFNNIYPGWTSDGKILYASGLQGEKSKLKTVETSLGLVEPYGDFESFFARQSPDGSIVAAIMEAPLKGIYIISSMNDQPELLVSERYFLEN